MQNQIVRIFFEDILTVPGLTFQLEDEDGLVANGAFPTNTDCLVLDVGEKSGEVFYGLKIENADGDLYVPKVRDNEGCGGIVIVGNVDIHEDYDASMDKREVAKNSEALRF